MREPSACGQELLRRTFLNDPALVENDHMIRILYGAHPMGDDDHGLILSQPADRSLYLTLILNVQTGRCLVQKDNRRVLQQGSRNRDPPPRT